MSERDPVVVEEQDGAAHTGRDALDQRDEGIERLAQHGARRRFGVVGCRIVAELGEEASRHAPRCGAIREWNEMLPGEGERREASEPRGVGRGAESGFEL